MVYDPGDWLPPGDDSDQAHRAAYLRWLDAVQAWHAQHGYGSVAAAFAVPDEPFDADDMLAFNGQRMTRAELVELQAAYHAEHSG